MACAVGGGANSAPTIEPVRGEIFSRNCEVGWDCSVSEWVRMDARARARARASVCVIVPLFHPLGVRVCVCVCVCVCVYNSRACQLAFLTHPPTHPPLFGHPPFFWTQATPRGRGVRDHLQGGPGERLPHRRCEVVLVKVALAACVVRLLRRVLCAVRERHERARARASGGAPAQTISAPARASVPREGQEIVRRTAGQGPQCESVESDGPHNRRNPSRRRRRAPRSSRRSRPRLGPRAARCLRGCERGSRAAVRAFARARFHARSLLCPSTLRCKMGVRSQGMHLRCYVRAMRVACDATVGAREMR